MVKYFLKITSIICVILILSVSFTSCKSKSVSDPVNSGSSSDVSASEDNSSQNRSDVTTTKTDKTTSKDETTTAGEEETDKQNNTNTTTTKKSSSSSNKIITLTSGLESTDVSEVLIYYKLVANKNSGLKMKKKMSLASLDIGTLIIDGESDSPNRQKGIAFFEKGANLALSVASGTTQFPGNPSAIRVSDWLSAKAVNDGRYTTVTVKVKPQTDSYNGKEFEGSVGRSMQVLAGFDTALDSINKVKIVKMTADFEHGNVKIDYVNPTITLKVLNSTGELVKDSCKWSYTTKIYFNDLNATMKVMQDHTVTVRNSGGAVDYSVNY